MRFFALLPLVAAVMSLALPLASCAKETSKEEKKREETDRQFARIQQAAGSYSGYVQIADDAIVPLSLDLTASRNPQGGSDNPALIGSMRIGMFGGVTIPSASASYDSGNGKVAVTFKRSGATNAFGGSGAGSGSAAASATAGDLELRATLSNGALANAVLDGPNLGPHTVQLTTGGANLFSEQDSYVYDAEVADELSNGAITPNAQLNIKRETTPRVAPQTSDLPVLPPLNASLRFVNLGIVPQNIQDFQYDPLTGVVQLYFSNTSKIEIDNVFLTPDATKATSLTDWHPAAELDGGVFVGATKYGAVRLGGGFPGLGLDEATKISDLPPKYFTGTYKGTNSATISFPAIASLEYDNTKGNNSPEYPFPTFPMMTLKVLICSGTQPLKQGSFDLTALDQVKGNARFTDNGGASPSVEVQYLNNWQSFNGRFTTNTSGNIDTHDPQLQLKATSNITTFDCSATQTAAHPVARVRAAFAAAPGGDGVGQTINDSHDADAPLHYSGYIERDGQAFVPASVEIVPRRNPNGSSDQPTLLVNLTTGFFGALTVGSDVALFDWVTGAISATYHRAAGAAIELKMTLTDDALNDATITGPNLGTSRLTMRRSGTSYFDASPDSHFAFQLAGGTTPLAQGLLDIKRLDSDTTAPANIDLPSVPGLQVSLSFKSMAQSPQVAKTVLYDSLRGTLSLVFGDSSRIELTKIFLTPGAGGSLAAPNQLSGAVFVAGSSRASINTTRLATAMPATSIGLLPPATYVGTYQGSAANAIRFRAVAYIDYLGHEGQNTTEFAFPTFPALRMRLAICDPSGLTLSERIMELGNYDHLTGGALFKLPPSGGGQGGDLQLATGLDWQNLTGDFTISGGSSSPSDTTAKVVLGAAPLGANGCLDPSH